MDWTTIFSPIAPLLPLVPLGTLVSGAIGGLGKFVWDKVEARFVKIEADLGDCRSGEALSTERRANMSQRLELLAMATMRLDAHAPELVRCKELETEYREIPLSARAAAVAA